jgi:hypothetical protein
MVFSLTHVIDGARGAACAFLRSRHARAAGQVDERRH